MQAHNKTQIRNLIDTGKLLEALNLIDNTNSSIETIMLKGRVNRLKLEKDSLPSSIEEIEGIKKSIYELVGLDYIIEQKGFSKNTLEQLEQSKSFKKRLDQLYKELSPNTPSYDKLLFLTKKYDQLKKENLIGLMTQDTYTETMKQIGVSISELEQI